MRKPKPRPKRAKPVPAYVREEQYAAFRAGLEWKHSENVKNGDTHYAVMKPMSFAQYVDECKTVSEVRNATP